MELRGSLEAVGRQQELEAGTVGSPLEPQGSPLEPQGSPQEQLGSLELHLELGSLELGQLGNLVRQGNLEPEQGMGTGWRPGVGEQYR